MITEQLLVGGQVLDVSKVELSLRSWTGSALAHTRGGKPLLDFGGRPVFAELCVYELARLSGWDARWVSTFGAATELLNRVGRREAERAAARAHSRCGC